MPAQTTRYDFMAQLARGARGEDVLDRLFRRWYALTPATQAEQRRGIDRHFVTPAGRRLTVEYKTDWTAARTGNAFVETVSVDTAGTPGWAYTSQAAYLVYFIPPDGLVYVLTFAALRAQLRAWTQAYPTRAIPNTTYHTHGLLVPLREFEALAETVLSI
jgi:hypothetical protein